MKVTLKRLSFIVVFTTLISICLYLLILLYTQRGPMVSGLGIFTLIVIGILPALYVYAMMKHDNTQWINEQEEKCNMIRKAMNAEDKQCEKENILELMLANMKDLREYYELSRRQAKNAFFLAVILCLIGAILLIVALVSFLLLPNHTDALTFGAIGGTVVEFIAGTSLLIYKKTIQQLNHYYRSLHENERFLLVLNLATKLPEAKQEDVYMKIIESQLPYINEENWMNIKENI